MLAGSVGNLTDALAAVVAADPECPLSFPSEGRDISVRELATASGAATVALAGLGVEGGDRIGVLSRNSPDFLIALFAAVGVGAAACPLPLPTSARDLSGYASRLTGIIAAAGISRILVDDRLGGMASRLAEVLAPVELIPVGSLTAAVGAGGPPRPHHAEPGELAVVQFTSGSTAAPKGVRLTHRNILAGTAAIAEGLDIRPGEDHGGLWLPMFHDMGLFGTLAGMFAGIPMTAWSPGAFVRDPARWLRGFAALGGTMSPAPSFGYEALVESVPSEEVSQLDLSRWRVALNGAEPIRMAGIEGFLEHFAPAGFTPAAMLPVYGMAEATLAVTFPPLGRAPTALWVDRDRLAADGVAVEVPRDDRRARGLPALGQPVRGVRIRVVDEHGNEVADRAIGDIEIAGDPVTSGYLTAPSASPAPAPDVDGWLSTGDLGFQHAGELYVTGRRKEMIIVRGVNVYPEDAESVIRDAPGLHRGRCVAFADVAADGAECITVVGESALEDPADRARLAADLRAAVSGALSLPDVAVRLVGPDDLPRTSSGKFQRLAARELTREAAHLDA
ncbi:MULTISPECIES: AMP-binding protein [unclassified Pseudofrankia]|uniref:AMP-binding protein n=1 Tax=unclassified Pseudofrankia TaxID=2994372 RepID=UPI0008D9505A|nr:MULTISPECIES: AMP-binding protein [unclassified Pseudofrankia]MDT3443235.1 AMP-binding protein [Pseudofrankia sp. BMG5.37]OHV62739.1 AMP-dependent synthetase [Pseudofrankia sp. BMG5.36]